jgi:hypothetical protein
MRWRLYAEEGLAGKEADLWLLEKTLTVEHAGEPLSAYEVAYDARPPGHGGGISRLLEVKKPKLFETPFVPHQPRLFGLAEDPRRRRLAEGLEAGRLRAEGASPPGDGAEKALFARTDAV